jgi:hypothetical protein
VNIEFDERVVSKPQTTDSIWSISHNPGRRHTGAEPVRRRDPLDTVHQTGLRKRRLQAGTALDQERKDVQLGQPGQRRVQIMVLKSFDLNAATAQALERIRLLARGRG